MGQYTIHPVMYSDGDVVAMKDPDDRREPDAFTIYQVDRQGYEREVSEDKQSMLEAIKTVNDFEDMTTLTLTKVAIAWLVNEIDNF